MNLQQLRYVSQVVRSNLNVSGAADVLYTSQPGVSKQIRQLETELGVDIFYRRGKRLIGITDPGYQVVAIIERILRDADNLRKVGDEFSHEATGKITIATTHTQARHVLPKVLRQFMQMYPQVTLSLHQGNAQQVSEWVLGGQADVGVGAAMIESEQKLVLLPCSQWNRCVIAKPSHPILAVETLTLEDIARYPLITNEEGLGRGAINKAFLGRGLKPHIVLTAVDTDVIKTYVAFGMGIGLIEHLAYDAQEDKTLGMIDARHLFETAMTHLALRRNSYLRGYVYGFIETYSSSLTRAIVDVALGDNKRPDYQL